MIVFPTGLFGFLSQEADIERQTIRGGTSLSGEQDVVSADGGGRVFAEFMNGSAIDRAAVLAWRALLAQMEEGATRVVVPFCDARHTPYGGGYRVPHSDDTPHSDGTLYVGGGPQATLAGALALRATTAQFNALFPQPLIGGEWFSIQHANKGWRAYKVRRVISPTQVEFVPPLREATPAGVTVDFRDPKCTMVQEGRASSRLENGRYSAIALRFVEAP